MDPFNTDNVEGGEVADFDDDAKADVGDKVPPPQNGTEGEVEQDEEDGFNHNGEQDDDQVEAITISDGQDVTSAILGGGKGSMDNVSIKSSSPVPNNSRIREEPETIRKWRVEQEKRLAEKDAKEEKLKEEMRQKAKKDLDDWNAKYQEQLKKTKEENRKSEKNYVTPMEEIKPGTEWERVAKLCDFNVKHSKTSKDVSRMKNILLQLKQNPKPVLSEK